MKTKTPKISMPYPLYSAENQITWSDLNNKIIKIGTHDTGEKIVVFGRDVQSDVLYVLAEVPTHLRPRRKADEET